MKKIIILFILFFNLIPIIKKGELDFLNSNAINAQSMGEEIGEHHVGNFHLLIYDDGNDIKWDPVSAGPQDGGGEEGPGGGAQPDMPPSEIDYFDEIIPHEQIEDEDGLMHAWYYGTEYLYEWDPLDLKFQLQVSSSTPNPKPRYYITVNYETHRYYEGDKIYIQKQNTPVMLTIQNEDGKPPSPGNYKWIRNGGADTVKCTAIINCNFIVDKKGVTQVRVDSLGKTLIKNPLIVSDKPTIIFKRWHFYTGDYGFDDSSHKHYDLRARTEYRKGLEVRKINEDTSYVVPWMSIYPQSQYTIEIQKMNLDSNLQNDPNFWVAFVPEVPNISLDINNIGIQHFNYAQLVNQKLLVIDASEWMPDINDLKLNHDYNALIRSIYAITNTGDTIGKLNITCSHPEERKVAIVYVNSGTGLNTDFYVQPNNIINYLNNNSHSQIFRKYTLDPVFANHPYDTLNMQADYALHPEWLLKANDSIYPSLFYNYYKTRKNIDIVALNHNIYPDAEYFVFVTNFPMTKIDTVGGMAYDSTTNGITFKQQYSITLFKNATNITVAHEVGHVLGLFHTFEDIPIDLQSHYHIPQYATTNFMDYTPFNGIDMEDMFYYSQWIDLR